MPAKASVECPPEFRSAASLERGAASGELRLALRLAESAQAIDIKRILDGAMLSHGRFSAILVLASSRLKTTKVAEKDTQAFENMRSSTKWRPQKAGLLAQKRAQTSPNLALFARKDVLAAF